MKHRTSHYYPFPRQVFPILLKSKDSTKWLFTVLCELEHQFTGNKVDFFYRSLKDLSGDTGQSSKTIIKGLKELSMLGLIEKWQMHWTIEDSKKFSEKHITAIRIKV